MKEMSRLDEFRQATLRARQHAAEEREALQAASSRPPEPGDVYLFPGEGDIATRWVVVARHLDRSDLLYAVPADGNPLFGLADLPLTGESGRRLTLRCGLGLWLPFDLFRGARRIGILAPGERRGARDKMQQVISGALVGPEAARESEANPDYRGWITLVGTAVDRFAAVIREPVLVLNSSEFRPFFPFGRPPAAKPGSMDLAAASADIEGEGVASPESLAVQSLGCPIALLYPGQLSLILEADGVAILYHTESGTAPPPVFSDNGAGDWQAMTWSVVPVASAARMFAPWVGESVRLRFGEGNFSREVTVSRQ